METAGPLEMAQLLVAHRGVREAWLLALSIFERIHRKDLWERGRREDLVRDPRETYRDHVRRKFRLMEDRNARLGECVNFSHRYTRLLLVKEHSTPLWAQQKLLDTGRAHARAGGHQASLIQMDTLLIHKKLLPEASLLITTRPTALERLQRLLEHPRHVEILGFSEAERKEYFYKYFQDAERARHVFSFVRDNEPLFTLCFVPLVCWVVCTCLKQQLEGGGLRRQATRTTTAVYLLYLLSLMQPKPGSPTLQRPPNQTGLCSLAADGLWSQKILFEEQDLRRHGLDGADVSSFLNMNIFQKDINCEKFYSFIHLSFQEFFAAVYYVLDGADREERAELLEWIRGKALSEGSTLQQGALELLSCLYEIQEEAFIRRALSHFQVVVVSNMATKMEHAVSAFCLKHCTNALVLHLHGAAYRADEEEEEEEEEEEGARRASGPQTLLAPSPERNVLPDAYSDQLANALSTNPNLIELALYHNALGSQGVKLLCQGLRHPNCKLQNLRLGICRLSSAACEGLAAVLQSNRHLRELDLSFNDLGDRGMWWLCEGLQHPACRLQKLWLDSCGLTAKSCEDLSSTLGVNQTLTELYLTNNALGNAGVRRLCKRLRHPGCKLRVLWETRKGSTFLSQHGECSRFECPCLGLGTSLESVDSDEAGFPQKLLEDAGDPRQGRNDPSIANAQHQLVRLPTCVETLGS
ncbi:NACHT, LRR and PYD domains-containing protein 12 [Myotis brandtii]|uniref:NACHT, LRR and PYD domains-containing protein 12 n=1 Tax=Myotis brandtii TaxID=109478 RepID=S7MNC2_MYOBR|nr:NACHT, LRR and PYD domains-containing protein 12 [Myotis brandtii]